jgi:hypothetical protein
VREGDRGVAALEGQHVRQRPADEVGAPDDDDVRAHGVDAGLGEELEHAVGGAGEEGRVSDGEAPGRVGVEGVHVLGGGDQLLDGSRVEVVRQRQLHEDAVDGVVLVEVGDLRLEVGLGGVGGEDDLAAEHAGRLRRTMLHADVDLGGGVLADEDRRQTRRDAVLGP